MPITDTYLCWFNSDGPEDNQEILAPNHHQAALQFAKWAWRGKHMWYLPDHQKWDTVVVKHLRTGKVKRFNITREYELIFGATEVK